LTVNYFRAQKLISSGVVEGVNNSPSHHEKSLRLSHVPGPRTCPLPLRWQATRGLVTNQKKWGRRRSPTPFIYNRSLFLRTPDAVPSEAGVRSCSVWRR
jgi:hypothetical protein